jgi:hypothetical protein
MAVMKLMDQEEFFQAHPTSLWYVGFLHSEEKWFPLRLVSEPKANPQLDTLFVSRSLPVMDELVKEYAAKIPQVKETFVHYLHGSEIVNIVETYSLTKVALVSSTASHDLCGCGCSCG